MSNAKEVADQAQDQELSDEYNRILKVITQTSYRKFNMEDLQTFWHLADIGDRTCDMLMESASNPEQLEKSAEVQEVYQAIKELIEDTITKEKIRKGQVEFVPREKL